MKLCRLPTPLTPFLQLSHYINFYYPFPHLHRKALIIYLKNRDDNSSKSHCFTKFNPFSSLRKQAHIILSDLKIGWCPQSVVVTGESSSFLGGTHREAKRRVYGGMFLLEDKVCLLIFHLPCLSIWIQCFSYALPLCSCLLLLTAIAPPMIYHCAIGLTVLNIYWKREWFRVTRSKSS